ncbi:hypothetical protein EB835_05490 [Brevibacterium sp. S22]|nr:hypothetical protein EB835_05490 [Brevibacterium sp. S22]
MRFIEFICRSVRKEADRLGEGAIENRVVRHRTTEVSSQRYLTGILWSIHRGLSVDSAVDRPENSPHDQTAGQGVAEETCQGKRGGSSRRHD